MQAGELGAGAARHSLSGNPSDAPQPEPASLSISQPESPLAGVPRGLAQPRLPTKTRRRGKSTPVQKRPRMLAVDDEPVLLTRAQAAQLAQISLSKLDQWSREPGCPVIREGTHFVRFNRETFIAWLAERSTQH